MSSQRQASPRTEDYDRLHGLLEAHRSITDDLSLTAVLDRIVRAACDLVGARYGAIGVLAPDGSLEYSVRLDDLTTHPRSDGFPLHHPSMTSYLGVPIRVRGEAFGELYLADPSPGRFDADDEELVTALAATAGTAIENARLYDEARRSRDWLHASGDIARALLGDADNEVVLDLVARAFSVADADYACLMLPTDDGRLHVVAAIGTGAEDFRDRVFDPSESTMGKAILAAESIRTHDMTLWARADYDNRYDFGPAMIVPLVAQGDRGAILMMRGAGQVPFTAQDVELASTFAAQVALAMELNGARADAERARTLEERDRIAQDLNDNVMQRLFATGMGIQAIAGQVDDAELADRLARHIADLDDTIDQIRSRVFGLRDGVRQQR
jgi:GAF domain-containing protein